MNITANVKYVSSTESIITFSTETDSTKVTIKEWDEWGSITLNGTLYDFHCYVNEDVVGVYVYGLTDANNDGILMIDSTQEYICNMVGDFINDARVWARLGDCVNVTPHNDVTQNFYGNIVGFKENRTIITVKDMDDDVWDCSVKFVNVDE